MRTPLLLSLTVPLLVAFQEEGPTTDAASAPAPVPVEVEATTSTVNDDGTFLLRLACLPLEDFAQAYSLRVALTGFEDLAVTEHALKPSTTRWRVGVPVDYEVALAFPPDAQYDPGEFVSVRIGFVEEGRTKAFPPRGMQAELVEGDGLADVQVIQVPAFAGPTGRATLDEVFVVAGEHKAKGEFATAWQYLERGLRDAVNDATKERFRDALLEVGRRPPAAASPVELDIIGERIRAEKARYFRLIAGRMYDRRQRHGALRLLEEAGGALAESADQKVIGALDEADRVTRRIDDIREVILTDCTADEQTRIDALVEKLGRTEALFTTANELAAKGDYAVALALYRKLRRVDGIDLYDRAQRRLEEVGEEYLAFTPPAEAEQVRAVLKHPAWDRTTTVESHCFLFIGPEQLVKGIPAESKLHFDLAYVFITDLFGRVPNPQGDRITVYFKELWDFGGGVGGGKIIDIGNADPSPGRAVRVDTGLFYHELTHCVDDTSPVYGGFHEGLANLGAAFAHEALDQEGDALHSFQSNLAQFKKYFLERDLEYWRIQNYGPSAGFFLHFVDTYSSGARGAHDWAPLRRFFREYRDAPVRDGREPYVARSLGHYLVRAYGPRAFDDLMRFGFPLEESDRRLLARELLAFETGEEVTPFEDRYAEHPNSPLPRDAVERDLAKVSRRNDREGAAALRRELGVVFDWKVVGPFFAQRADPEGCIFEPELSIDFKSKPKSWRASRADMTQRVWQDPIPDWVPTDSHKNVTLFPSGWIQFDYQPYGDDDSAIYALTHVTVPEAVDATAHIRADDDFVLFVNDRRIDSYRGRGTNGSSNWLLWRGPYEHAPDGMRMPVHFAAGRNKVLVKIRNRGGMAGLALAFSRPDGSPLAFTTDADEPDPPGPRAPVAEPSWKKVVTIDHRTFKSKAKIEVGSFRARNKAFYGDDTDGRVKWRLFTVRPGFPKDSPSNLLWLKPAQTKDLDALKIDVELASADPPKLLLTFQGEGEDDGLSGWNLILVPSGNDAVQARLERYDRLVYHSDPVPLPAAPGGRTLSLRYWDGWCTLTIGDEVVFDRLPIHPIPGRTQVGLATWGPKPEIRSLELSKGR